MRKRLQFADLAVAWFEGQSASWSRFLNRQLGVLLTSNLLDSLVATYIVLIIHHGDLRRIYACNIGKHIFFCFRPTWHHFNAKLIWDPPDLLPGLAWLSCSLKAAIWLPTWPSVQMQPGDAACFMILFCWCLKWMTLLLFILFYDCILLFYFLDFPWSSFFVYSAVCSFCQLENRCFRLHPRWVIWSKSPISKTPWRLPWESPLKDGCFCPPCFVEDHLMLQSSWSLGLGILATKLVVSLGIVALIWLQDNWPGNNASEFSRCAMFQCQGCGVLSPYFFKSFLLLWDFGHVLFKLYMANCQLTNLWQIFPLPTKFTAATSFQMFPGPVPWSCWSSVGSTLRDSFWWRSCWMEIRFEKPSCRCLENSPVWDEMFILCACKPL